MEAPEHVTGSHSSSSTGESPSAHPSVTKRKRTKRQRALSPPPPPPLASSSSTSSVSAATEEEEDMAHCLILLAQGRSPPSPPPPEKFTSRKFTEAATTAGGGKAGFYVYECKTCNKCFPSFQALGGHRASHKKPKMSALPTYAEEKIAADPHHEPTVSVAVPPLANSHTGKLSAAVTRVHECSVCGAEFSSGQALGGHMRRHRPIGAAPTLPPPLTESPSPSREVKKERSLLSLDLNLPAPAEENSPPQPPPPAFSFADKRPMVFSALVDCHY